MVDELPLTPAARRHVINSDHYDSIQQAGQHPVETHPADDDMSLVGKVIGGRKSLVQTRIGADGTRVDVAWGRRGPARIIRVSPPGGGPRDRGNIGPVGH